MRGGKSFLVLVVLAVGLGAYIYFVESKRDLTDPATKHDKVFTVDSSKIEEIDVKSSSGDETKLTKDGTNWRIAAPEAADADGAAASSVVATLDSLEAQRVVDEKPASVAPFGLEPPRYSVTFKVAGDATPHRLNIGSKTPNGADVYARVEGQQKLILVSASTDDALNRSTFDFREKSVLKVASDAADSLKLEATGAPAVVMAKKGTDWRLNSPVEAKADTSTAEGLVTQITQAKMKTLVATIGATGLSPADQKKYGLDKPQLVATIGAGSAHATLAIGAKVETAKPADAAKPVAAKPDAAKPAAKPGAKPDAAKPAPEPDDPNATYYARDLSRPMVFTVDKALVDAVKRKADEFRSKDVFDFRAFSAISADITLGGQTYTFAKEKNTGTDPNTAGTESWKQTKPAAKDVNQTSLTDVLTNLSNLRADKFADKPFASGEELVVAAKFGDAASPKEERVVFRKSGGVVHAIRAGEPGAAIIPTADYDKAVAGFKELAGIK